MTPSNSSYLRFMSAAIVVLVVAIAAVTGMIETLQGRDISPWVITIVSGAFTPAIGFIFLDKGVTLHNGETVAAIQDTRDAVKQLAAAQHAGGSNGV